MAKLGFTASEIASKKYVDDAIANAGGGVTVDQTYSPTSENAQSGKAVAEAITQSDDKIDKRLPKLTAWTSQFKRVLTLKENIEASQEGTMPDNAYEYINVNNVGSKYAQGEAANALALRDNNGNLWTYAPVDEEDCVNKKYVDEKIAEIPSGGAVDDVKINGASIVENGVANIPFADSS